MDGGIQGLCNIEYLSETHVKPKSHDISFAHNLFWNHPLVIAYPSQMHLKPKSGEILFSHNLFLNYPIVIAYPSETHIKPKSCEISFVQNLFLNYTVVVKSLKMLHTARAYRCHALCKIYFNAIGQLKHMFWTKQGFAWFEFKMSFLRIFCIYKISSFLH